MIRASNLLRQIHPPRRNQTDSGRDGRVFDIHSDARNRPLWWPCCGTGIDAGELDGPGISVLDRQPISRSTPEVDDRAKRKATEMLSASRFRPWIIAVSPLLLVGIVLGSAVVQFRAAMSLTQRKSCIRSVLSELRDYDQTYRRLPAACEKNTTGDCMLSWRVAVLFYRGGYPLPSRPSPENLWNSPENERYLNLCAPGFCLPSSTDTVLFAVTGKGAAFDMTAPRRLQDLHPSTIVVIENRDAGVHWMAPIEFSVDPLLGASGDARWSRLMASYGRVGFNVGFADGTVWQLSSSIPLDHIIDFLLVDRAAQHNRDSELKQYTISPEK